SSPPQSAPAAAGPLFRARQDIPAAAPASIPAVIPIVRAPDDPGIDADPVPDEFAEQIGPAQGQAGGWRGFLSRWGGETQLFQAKWAPVRGKKKSRKKNI